MDHSIEHLDFEPSDPSLRQGLASMPDQSVNHLDFEPKDRKLLKDLASADRNVAEKQAAQESEDKLKSDILKYVQPLLAEFSKESDLGSKNVEESMVGAWLLGYVIGRRDLGGSFVKKHGFDDPAKQGPLNSDQKNE